MLAGKHNIADRHKRQNRQLGVSLGVLGGVTREFSPQVIVVGGQYQRGQGESPEKTVLSRSNDSSQNKGKLEL